MLSSLRQHVYDLHLELPKHNLVVWTMGNLSARDPETGLVVIKPSGVRYEHMTPDDMVIVDLDANVVEGHQCGFLRSAESPEARALERCLASVPCRDRAPRLPAACGQS